MLSSPEKNRSNLIHQLRHRPIRFLSDGIDATSDDLSSGHRVSLRLQAHPSGLPSTGRRSADVSGEEVNLKSRKFLH